MTTPIRIATGCLLASAALLSSEKPATADEAPTREYVVDETRPPPSTRWKLFFGGLGATAAFYGVAQPFSYAWSDAKWSTDLRYPVIGPWMALAHNSCPESDPDCSTVWLVARGILEGLNGIAQAGGLAIAVEGLFVPTESETRSPKPGSPPLRRPKRSPPEEPPSSPGNLFYLPRPIVIGNRGIGVGISGVF